MTYGARAWDADGNMTLDVTTNAGRLTGSVETGGVDGSHVAAGFDTGQPFWVVQPFGLLGPGNAILPVVSGSGATLSWYYPAGSDGRVNCIIRYGVR